MAQSPDGRLLAVPSLTGVKLWDSTIQRQLISLQNVGEFTGWTGFSPDGNTLLGLSWSGVADLYRAPSWEKIEAKEKEKKTP